MLGQLGISRLRAPHEARGYVLSPERGGTCLAAQGPIARFFLTASGEATIELGWVWRGPRGRLCVLS